MLSKLSKIMLFLLCITVAFILCWLVVAWNSWPLWSFPVLLLGVIAAFYICKFVAYKAYAFGIHQRMKHNLLNKDKENTSALDGNWLEGIKLLRHSRLNRLGSPLYALPWFLVVGDEEKDKNVLLNNSGLHSTLASSLRRHTDRSSEKLKWWFFERSIFLEPSGDLFSDTSTDLQWKRLLHWLFRSRRREPLNGVILVLNIETLLSKNKNDLQDLGFHYRHYLDDLENIYSTRVPVYLILTGCQNIEGFNDWLQIFSAQQCEQPLGLISESGQDGIGHFLENVFSAIHHRLSELRMIGAANNTKKNNVLLFPQRIASLKTPLESMLVPAFDEKTYSNSPLLKGLFFVGENTSNERSECLFSKQLLGNVLADYRYDYQPITRFSNWRRFLTHTAVVGWLTLCVGACAWLFFANHYVEQLLSEITNAKPENKTQLVSRDLYYYGIKLETVENKRDDNFLFILPFRYKVNDALAVQWKDYVSKYSTQIKSGVLSGFIRDKLPAALLSDNDTIISAYVQHLVRSINLLNARLAGRSLQDLPVPGREMATISQFFSPQDSITLSSSSYIGEGYRDYLTHQTDIQALKSERRQLLDLLKSMGLGDRSLSWVIAFANSQGNIPAIRFDDFWYDPEYAQMQIAPAYTVKGLETIRAFIDELKAATPEKARWKLLYEPFFEQYHKDTQRAWFNFIHAVLQSSSDRPKVYADWKDTLYSLNTDKDPFHKMLKYSAERFKAIPVKMRNPSSSLAIRLYDQFSLSDHLAAMPKVGVVNKLETINVVVGDKLKEIATGKNILPDNDGLSSGMTEAQIFNQFYLTLDSIVSELRQNDEKAKVMIYNSWEYNRSPDVKASLFLQADNLRNTVKTLINYSDPESDTIWKLATGGLDFALDYSVITMACDFQKQWDNRLLSSIKGVNNPATLSDILFGDNGKFKDFMSGDINNYIQNVDGYYSPRVIMNKAIPFNEDFYSYINKVQYTDAFIKNEKQKVLVSASTQALDKQNLENNKALLQAEIESLQQQLQKLQNFDATINLNIKPVQVNNAAREIPLFTRLTMQCSKEKNVLENYNFPNGAQFHWEAGSCLDTTLEIVFNNYSLVKRWPGANGFIDFLKDFRGGVRQFSVADFPRQRNNMLVDNINKISLSISQDGEKDILGYYEKFTDITNKLDAANSQFENVSVRLSQFEVKNLNQKLIDTVKGTEMQQRLTEVLPPSSIAQCWK